LYEETAKRLAAKRESIAALIMRSAWALIGQRQPMRAKRETCSAA